MVSLLKLHRSLIVTNVLEECSKDPSACSVAYFYCARSDAEPHRADPDEIMCAVLKQLSTSRSGPPIKELIVQEFTKRKEEAEQDGSEPLKLTAQESTSLIIALTDTNPVVIIIDALDECRPDRRYELFQSLEDLVEKSARTVKIFLSSRDDMDIIHSWSSSPNISITANENGEDIERFIHSEVESSINSRRLLYGQVSNELKSDIIKYVIDKAQGMLIP
jgi:hypothetical protein